MEDNKIEMVKVIGMAILRTGRGILWGSIGIEILRHTIKAIKKDKKEAKENEDAFWEEIFEN